MITKFKNAQNIFTISIIKRTCLIKKALFRGLWGFSWGL
ncbi:hypothetical protein HPHPP23_1217 [Helicobacter pylori Hp P-23]|uniref:Uncharacterized protein n=1 Tax=Helicobacter pylori Hp P-15 TaxID=992080 RepID=J0F709_HELPX|nr:hypothetical protein HPHPP15_1169 [Helicobacter pylori Hp P-15]EJC12957.1 hypothetical protein HPHPP23_1217 [Helicobacter pylori Hp P-23]EJC16671.1 hypothetical protein HPHPP74_1484 [Helicobacter pylori Hp P-74]EJC32600.1 hypothetical protein HPHPP15B_1436 [Helicobacter pylori Hp P-15b]